MITETDIDFILSTFEIPVPLSNRVRSLIGIELKETGFSHFDHLYSRIASLIESFRDYSSRFLLRLDEPLVPDGRETKHSVISKDTVVDECEEGIPLTLDELTNLLHEKVDPELLMLLRNKVIGTDTSLFYCRPDRIVINAEEIESRLRKVVHHFERQGKILIPPRPIIEIKWNPQLWVRYGRRKFNGNPAQFYKDNMAVYEEFRTRKALRKFDPSMLYALRDAGQLDAVLPALPTGQPRQKFTDEQVQELIEAYYAADTNAAVARRNVPFEISKKVLTRILREHGIYRSRKRDEGPITYFGEKMVQRIRERGLIVSDGFYVNQEQGIYLRSGETMHVDDACDSFGILSTSELERYVKDDSWLVRKTDRCHIDRLSALYLATLAPIIGLRSTCSALVGGILAFQSPDEAEGVLQRFALPTTSEGTYKTYYLRKGILNPSFKEAVTQLELTN